MPHQNDATCPEQANRRQKPETMTSEPVHSLIMVERLLRAANAKMQREFCGTRVNSYVIPSGADSEGPRSRRGDSRAANEFATQMGGSIVSAFTMARSFVVRSLGPSRTGIVCAARDDQKPVVICYDPTIFPAPMRTHRGRSAHLASMICQPHQRMRSRRSKNENNNSLKEESRDCGIKQNAKSN
jgi:hypothetical protein